MTSLREAAQAVYDEFVDDVNEKDAPIIFGKLKALGHALRTTIDIDIFAAAWRKAEVMLRAQHLAMRAREFREGYAAGYSDGADQSATFDDDAAVQRWAVQRAEDACQPCPSRSPKGNQCIQRVGHFGNVHASPRHQDEWIEDLPEQGTKDAAGLCNEVSPDGRGYQCSEPLGHSGECIARGTVDGEIRRWAPRRQLRPNEALTGVDRVFAEAHREEQAKRPRPDSPLPPATDEERARFVMHSLGLWVRPDSSLVTWLAKEFAQARAARTEPAVDLRQKVHDIMRAALRERAESFIADRFPMCGEPVHVDELERLLCAAHLAGVTGDGLVPAAQEVWNSFLEARSVGDLSGAMNELRLALERHFLRARLR